MGCKRREFSFGLSMLGLAAGAPAAGLSETDAASGVRAALERGAIAAVDGLGRTDGFLGDARVRIPLPPALDNAARLLRSAGQGKRVDELVTSMNRAAEAAVQEAKPLFVQAVRSMSVEDALRLVRDSRPTAVTDWFAAKTRTPLAEKFLPVVTKATEKVKLAEQYNALAGKAATFGLVKGAQANVQQYVTERALDGLFLMVGEEEKKIRANPAAAGSAILKKVFGG